MGDARSVLLLPAYLTGNLEVLWTFVLLTLRFGGLMMTLPGIGGGMRGLAVRGPAVLAFSFASLRTDSLAALPADYGVMLGQGLSEVLLGFFIGVIPLMVVTAVQTGAQLASTTMGLGAGNLIDPTLGITTSDLGRIIGDLSIVILLLMGGHYTIVYAAAGLGGAITPGTFLVGEDVVQLLIQRSGEIFRIGVLLAAPVIVALLLTNFVMGLISRAVPTVNIFIINFPLTIGIGLVLTVFALRDMSVLIMKDFNAIDAALGVLVK